jgi:hypothetical protein
LDVHSRPHNPAKPVVCTDEKPYRLLDEVREPVPAEPGRVEKADSEYKRKGTRGVFIFTGPLAGRRFAEASERGTKADWAQRVKRVSDNQYPDAEKVVLVTGNLNTRVASSLYEAFPPEEAFRLAQGLEIHYTPKHGSWLDIAGIELPALAAQCPGARRIPCIESLNKELAARETRRNAGQKGVNWHFATDGARIKLKRLYPVFL